uniref:Mitochondrial thiamine pyrophosphate carrier 1 n=1 Tax=Plectus sambesii TaxID=2011161 RepID=A0A914UQ21_9BILA
MVGFDPNASKRELTTAEYSAAGLVSGVLTRFFIQPLDVLKIRFQLQIEPTRGKSQGKYNGLFQAIRLIAREEGAAAFWKGHVPAQGLSAIYGFVQFAAFERLSKAAWHLLPPHASAKWKQPVDFVCGAGAGCFAMTAALPADLIRTRLVAQGEPKHYKNSRDVIASVWRHEGPRAFFSGLTPALLQVAPFTGIQFAIYRWTYSLWHQLTTEHDSTGTMLCGALAGTIAKTALYPFDVFKHRRQIAGFEKTQTGSATSAESRGLINAFRLLVQREGYTGLFKGLYPSMIKAAVSSALTFLFYEIVAAVSGDRSSRLAHALNASQQLLLYYYASLQSTIVVFSFPIAASVISDKENGNAAVLSFTCAPLETAALSANLALDGAR